jgi:hypothetical protein
MGKHVKTLSIAAAWIWVMVSIPIGFIEIIKRLNTVTEAVAGLSVYLTVSVIIIYAMVSIHGCSEECPVCRSKMEGKND